jgi:DNA gyrase/topoisomerase IV subunit A
LPAEGEIFLLTNDGRAKRVDQKEFPVQGRYGKGVVAWDLPNKTTLVAAATGKPNHVLTVHMSKGAAKSVRMDEAGLRKRAASKGDLVVEVKPGENITALAVGWTVERFIKTAKAMEEKPVVKKAAKKAAPAKAKKAAAKKPSKPASKAKKTPAKKISKPVKSKPAAKKKKK